MTATASLLVELERALQHGSREKRTETLRRVTDLFLDRADSFSDHHVAVFDGVLGRLIEEIESKARSELSRKLAPIGNAPTEVVRRLAHDDDISVAAPVLQQSQRLAETDLVNIAKTKSQAHLLAISGRDGIGEAVTDVLVRRGDKDVAHNVAENSQARLSEDGFSTLVKRAEKDGVLAEKVGLRSDIPSRLFRELVLRATDVVRKRLLATARPDTQDEIRRVLGRIADEMRGAKPHDYTAALRKMKLLHEAGELDEGTLVACARAGQYEEMVASLSLLCGVPIEVVDRLLGGDRPDPALILCKAVGFAWDTVQAIIRARSGTKPVSAHTLESALANFERLSPPTATRVVRFWQLQNVGLYAV
jgi:uncharacterized protein (DUF2336 family)